MGTTYTNRKGDRVIISRATRDEQGRYHWTHSFADGETGETTITTYNTNPKGQGLWVNGRQERGSLQWEYSSEAKRKLALGEIPSKWSIDPDRWVKETTSERTSAENR